MNEQLSLDLGLEPEPPIWIRDMQRMSQVVNSVNTHLANADHGAARDALRVLMDHAWVMFGRTYVEYRHPTVAPEL